MVTDGRSSEVTTLCAARGGRRANYLDRHTQPEAGSSGERVGKGFDTVVASERRF